MYVHGVAALLLIIFDVLMFFGVIPFTKEVVAGLFALVALAFVGPYFIRTGTP